ncbi:MAG: toprim domain-containing protein [Proteobacteria bacterium]|nr:toprim domain-containing protein [Pseudomonadota bacterium]
MDTIPYDRDPTGQAMTAESIAKGLSGHKSGAGWMVRCPAHHDREPSLSITTGGDGKVLFRCHAGCDQAQVLGALRGLGLWEPSRRHVSGRNGYKLRQSANTTLERNNTKRTETALRIWQASAPSSGTPVESYLQSRGLHLHLPSTLSFHIGLKHPSGGRWPAMVALVTRGTDDTPLAIHRTFLTRDGSCKAPVDPQKMMLGPCRGGAVRLGTPRDVLMVGEGIETCLAAMQATGNPTWAALSTSGLRTLDLPDDVREVIVLADGDDPGEAAARSCALRWQHEGRRVRIARPPQGMDFNDMLLGRTSRIKGGLA